jgi:small subunit ribosomal protein S6
VTKYEILLLLDPELDDGRQGEIVERVQELVAKNGGTWDLHDLWGRRRLAYEIDHKVEGSYHLLHFTSDAATLEEISRVLRIDDGVMRHMATRRIAGSPARPVAVSAPARQDAEVQDSGPADSETPAPAAPESGAADAEVEDEPIEVAATAETAEEG